MRYHHHFLSSVTDIRESFRFNIYEQFLTSANAPVTPGLLT
ncbi:MAG TPA: hypothetical protein VF906_00665 [Candidatus Bathyarchaeia archaeon]